MQILLAASSALLLTIAWTSGGFPSLVWIALVPWLLSLETAKTLKRQLQCAVVFGALLMVGIAYWLTFAMKEFVMLPLPLVGLGMVLFALFNAAPFVLYTWGRSYLKPRLGALFPLFAGILFVAWDAGFPKIFRDTMGQILVNWSWLRQTADLAGIYLLTGLVVLFNECVLELVLWYRAGRDRRTFPRLAVIAPVVALILGNLYGFFREKDIRAKMADAKSSVNVGIIQANIGNILKRESESGAIQAWKEVIDTYLEFSRRALEQTPRPQVLVWPETAFPSTFGTPQNPLDAANQERIRSFVRESGVPLVFGGYDVNMQTAEVYNSLFSLQPSQELDIYRKSRLMPFGDTVPGAQYMPWLKNLFPQLGLFGRGPGPEVLTVKTKEGLGVRFSPLICYEGMFTDYTVKSTRLTPHFLLNLTNDSWFGPRGEPYFHFQAVTFRSIETRRPQIRSTNTGISALILPDGSTSRLTPVYQPDILNVTVPLMEPTESLVLILGDWFPGFCIVMSLGAYARFRLRERSGSRQRAHARQRAARAN